jgi:SAM-dependent methyltransferase
MNVYFTRTRSKEDYFRFQEIGAIGLLEYLRSKSISIEGKRILDCGASLGGYSKVFSRNGGKVLPFDIDRDSLDYLRRRSGEADKDVPCVQGDASDMPFKDSSFDIILAVSLIEHLPEQEEFLKEAFRCTGDGCLLLTFPPYYSLLGGHSLKPFHLLPEKLAILIGKKLGRIDKSVESLEDISLFPLTISKAMEIIKKVGFKIVALDSRYTSSFFCRFHILREFLVPHCMFLLQRPKEGAQ